MLLEGHGWVIADKFEIVVEDADAIGSSTSSVKENAEKGRFAEVVITLNK